MKTVLNLAESEVQQTCSHLQYFSGNEPALHFCRPQRKGSYTSHPALPYIGPLPINSVVLRLDVRTEIFLLKLVNRIHKRLLMNNNIMQVHMYMLIQASVSPEKNNTWKNIHVRMFVCVLWSFSQTVLLFGSVVWQVVDNSNKRKLLYFVNAIGCQDIILC